MALSKSFSCAFGLVFVLSGCNGDDNAKTYTFSDVYCPSVVLSSSAMEGSNYVIDDQNELNDIWSDLGYSAYAAAPQIDFSFGTAILVNGGFKANGNEWVEIVGVTEESGQTVVTYNDFSSNFEGCGGDAVVTYPFCLVQLNTKISEAVFRSRLQNSCDSESGGPTLLE